MWKYLIQLFYWTVHPENTDYWKYLISRWVWLTLLFTCLKRHVNHIVYIIKGTYIYPYEWWVIGEHYRILSPMIMSSHIDISLQKEFLFSLRHALSTRFRLRTNTRHFRWLKCVATVGSAIVCDYMEIPVLAIAFDCLSLVLLWLRLLLLVSLLIFRLVINFILLFN